MLKGPSRAFCCERWRGAKQLRKSAISECFYDEVSALVRLSALIGTLRSLRRATHRATVVALAKKSVFNLRINTMEPLLGPLGSLLVGGDFRFQFRYPIFSPAKLMRKLLRSLQRISAVLFRDARCPVQHLQYCLACFVELISAVRRRGSCSPRKRNHSDSESSLPI